MGYYKCIRCGHIVTQKVEILRHLKRKNKCSRNISSYNYSDDEIFKLSLKKHQNQNEIKKNIIKKNIIKEMNNQEMNDQQKELLKNINHIDIIQNEKNDAKNKNNFSCNICSRIFSRKYNLHRHQQKCSSSKLSLTFEENVVNNTTNNYNTIHNNYNKNLFVNFNLEPFDNEWDVSKITKFTKHSILLSKIMYSNLLKTILENENNLNVLIEKDTNTGLVYKNNADKFITMNIKDIIEQSMQKLNKHLNDFYHESVNDDEFVLMNKIFEDQKLNIDNKYSDFKNNENIQDKVQEFITDIFDKKKEHAINLYNQVLLQNKKDDNNGY